MTLACKTADLLTLTTHSLNRVTSFGPYHLLSADDRKSALQQLSMTVQAAAKLAELAQPEVLGRHTEHVRVKVETERAGAGGGALGKDEDSPVGEGEDLELDDSSIEIKDASAYGGGVYGRQ
ncbi:uncharacterized protein LAJ45_10289 [Morchella importuna]|uniref:uncharacterized protein n=1 Tax=Morchella importuna TaxID=1174673 RepID=UPI001E8CFEB7|nr:uncharacterized protein LAJ45_10289 [Morchella importuna]KAH8145649.1 hypothetical protein LAJ45_10289 [Morchella importuna]